MNIQLHWERGYRTHGYWAGIVRWGWVGLGPRGLTLASRDGYAWEFTPHGIVKKDPPPEESGECRTLKEGKRIVERLCRAYLREHDLTLP
jgi:hypothetical protein